MVKAHKKETTNDIESNIQQDEAPRTDDDIM